jgi:Na+/H+ antiporter NhaA
MSVGRERPVEKIVRPFQDFAHKQSSGGWLAGIGFTMSLCITDRAFSEGSLGDAAKLGILVASVIAGGVGWTILRGASSPR